MKRFIILVLVCMFLLCGCENIEKKELNKSEGRLLICDNEIIVFVCDGSPIVLNVDDITNIDSFTDGDLVEVWHDYVLTSYPGQTKAHKITFIEDGTVFDIDNGVLNSLTDLGWIDVTEASLNKTRGRLLKCNNDMYMLIADGQPMVINVNDIDDITSYSDGDLLDVWHNEIMESYPAQTKANKIKLVEQGDISDVDEAIIKQLCEMGWITHEDLENRYTNAGNSYSNETTENYTMCEYKYCRMGIELPDTWESDVMKQEDECYIRFRPKGVNEGWVVLRCSDELFGVCGTGLRFEDKTIGGYTARVAYYDNNKLFSFITFDIVPGEYTVYNLDNQSWLGKYEKELMGILQTLILGTQQVSYNDIKSKINDSYLSNYEIIDMKFNCFKGIWTVNYYIDDSICQAKFNIDGDMLVENE